ncbi:unnamed protein product [Microthlaspi erraticum]|uniref:Calcineurin-like phosphoesterase domain-containing protein n=1 Tax=Microthlaspi erraticum TaxID=1685480 RepID=A0A6D2LB60_9BRAS|nr:unnamed protein product [Microthlaspi erraticum]
MKFLRNACLWVSKIDGGVWWLSQGFEGRRLLTGDVEDPPTPSRGWNPGSLNQDLKKTGLVFHIGDICYGNGYLSQWDQFTAQIEPIASTVPYMIASGNHERDWPNSGSFYQGLDSGGECGVPAETMFYVPAQNRAKFWYLSDYGMFSSIELKLGRSSRRSSWSSRWLLPSSFAYPVELLPCAKSLHAPYVPYAPECSKRPISKDQTCILADTEHDWREGTDQYKFIEHCLASVDRKTQPWLIFLAHRVLGYSSTSFYAEEGSFGEPMGRGSLQKLWQKYKVDIAIYVHAHNYEGTCPVYQVN